MLIKIIALFAVLAIAVQAAPVKDVKITKFVDENNDGSYNFAYEQSDGQTREEQGVLIEVEDEAPSFSVSGSYSFVGDDGKTYTVRYTADQNGFRAYGDHLPSNDDGPVTEEPSVGLPASALLSLVG